MKAAESGDILTALEFFSQAVQIAPDRASGYNNRAQALRLKGDIQGKGNAVVGNTLQCTKFIHVNFKNYFL